MIPVITHYNAEFCCSQLFAQFWKMRNFIVKILVQAAITPEINENKGQLTAIKELHCAVFVLTLIVRH